MARFQKVVLVACMVMVACEQREDVDSLPKCCSGLGTCLARTLIPPKNAASLGRASCEAGKLCLPDAFVDFENFVPATCRSTLGAEGRCFPKCLPDIAEMADKLARGDCPKHYLCAPCYDLISGEPTGLCELGGDPGPVDPPVLFDECCHAKGRCLPKKLVSEEEQANLDKNSCEGEDDLLCVPDPFLEEDYILKTCRSNLNAEGRCAPTCLPEIQAQEDDLPEDVCPAYYRCAPCYDPLTGDPTGICELGGDQGPSREPVVFEACCGDSGRCVPEDLVPEDQRSHLGLDACEPNQGLICVPDEFMEEDFVPTRCHGALHAEGRCVPECLPAVTEQADLLVKDVCPDRFLCAPCYDPFTGDATGICRLGMDPGPDEGPVIFDSCCEDRGWCIPATLIPEDQAARLGEDTCAEGDNLLCMPDIFLGREFELMTCRSTLGAEGRCAPICLPDVAANADELPQDICPELTRCAPCFDLRTGDATGVCDLGGDSGPSSEIVVFDKCCDELGSCVPEDLVSEDALDHLGLDTCENNRGLVCAPDAFMEDDFVLTTCHGILGAEGRCAPKCLPAVAKQADMLEQDVCSDDHLCAPCYDPFGGVETGLCALGSDPGPSEAPVVFDTCCGGLCTCVPADLVPVGQQDRLDAGGCGAEGDLECVPTFLFEEHAPEICQSILGAEGRCLPACLPKVAEQAAMLPEDICPPDHLCAPCYDPFTGVTTGACDFPGDRGPTRPPIIFEACCDGAGTCLPQDFVPADQRDLLGEGSCPPMSGFLCVPEALQDDGFVPTACTSIAGAEGRCLPDCLPAIEAQAAFLTVDVCDSGFRCAPCYDPFTGDATGACALSGDPGPTDPPMVFEKCCQADGLHIGTCMPQDVLPADMADQLIVDSCTDPDYLCAPDNVVLTPGAVGFPGCTTGGGEPGACVPACYLSWEETLIFPRASCGQGERCVTCYFAGQSTGVC